MAFCPTCGKQLPAGGLAFCPFCGSGLGIAVQGIERQPPQAVKNHQSLWDFIASPRYSAYVDIGAGLAFLILGVVGYLYVSNYASSTQSCLNNPLCSFSSGGASNLQSQLSTAQTVEIVCALISIFGMVALVWGLSKNAKLQHSIVLQPS